MSSAESPEPAGRTAAMAACAEATREELAALLDGIDPRPQASDLRKVESGLVMVRGRMGGDGRPFNLGEASVTRAAVSLPDGRTGYAYHLGRDREKARAAAVVDALWQGAERDAVERALQPLRERLEADAAMKARQVAATRVNFFTLVRGDD